MTCSLILQQQGREYPRTCADHGLWGCTTANAKPLELKPLKITIKKYHVSVLPSPFEKPWVVFCPVCRHPDWNIFSVIKPGTYAFFRTWDEALEAGNYHHIAHRQGNINTYHSSII